VSELESTPLDPRRIRTSDEDRERIARVLNDAMEQGRLTPSETSERLSSVYAAKTLGDLEPLTADLPEHAPLVPRQPTLPQPAPSNRMVDRAGGAPGSAFAVGVFSGATRRGRWVVPAQFSAVAIMGGVDLDLTQARFASRDTVITCVAFWGGIDIVVPEDLTVVVSGVGLLGAFEDNAQTEGPPGSPVVRINGIALMGGVEVKRPKKSRAEIQE
jgi:hypothetical protein